MSSPLPTILFLAGAFADPSCFDTIATGFHHAGYPTVYARVPSLNPQDPSSITTAKDGEHVRNTYLLPLLELGKDIIVFVHSYGGIVGGQAARGLAKATGKPGVLGLFYLVGNLVGQGQSLKEAIGGTYPPFIKKDYPSKGLAVIDPIMETLYGDISDSALRPQLEAAMTPHALAAFETRAIAPAWAEPSFDGRRVYVKTLGDRCNPLFVQDAWLERSGVRWETVDMEAAHCPFVSRPREVVEVCLGFFRKWAQ